MVHADFVDNYDIGMGRNMWSTWRMITQACNTLWKLDLSEHDVVDVDVDVDDGEDEDEDDHDDDHDDHGFLKRLQPIIIPCCLGRIRKYPPQIQ